EILEKHLTSHDPVNYEYIQSVIIHELKKRMVGRVSRISRSIEKDLNEYLNKGRITTNFLKEYTTKIKTDIELKLLMASFGFTLKRFPYSIDGTGSLDFSLAPLIIESDLVKDEALKTRKAMYRFMNTFLQENFKNSAIIINTGFHWVAACKLVIDDDRGGAIKLFYLDPAHNSHPVLLRKWSYNKKFYFFNLDEKLNDIIRTDIIKILELDGDGNGD
ncbi:MAG: hypothetical protein ACTSXP_02045, partial [Promethearchaeota archaeon]